MNTNIVVLLLSLLSFLITVINITTIVISVFIITVSLFRFLFVLSRGSQRTSLLLLAEGFSGFLHHTHGWARVYVRQYRRYGAMTSHPQPRLSHRGRGPLHPRAFSPTRNTHKKRDLYGNSTECERVDLGKGWCFPEGMGASERGREGERR